MGMTIEDSIGYIKDLRDAGGCGYQQANIAINTMCKYQKIEEIVKNTQQLCSYGSAFIDIRKVVEDGNDDN